MQKVCQSQLSKTCHLSGYLIMVQQSVCIAANHSLLSLTDGFVRDLVYFPYTFLLSSGCCVYVQCSAFVHL